MMLGNKIDAISERETPNRELMHSERSEPSPGALAAAAREAMQPACDLSISSEVVISRVGEPQSA